MYIYNFSITRGDDYELVVYFYLVNEEDGTEELIGDISDYDIIFTMRNISTDAIIIEKKSVSAGGEIGEIDLTEGDDSIAVINLLASNTQSLQAKDYKYDIEIVTDDDPGKVKTGVSGIVTILEDQTRH